MFDSKIDKFLCFAILQILGFAFGIQHGSQAYLPFAAVATLAFGLTVKEPSKGE